MNHNVRACECWVKWTVQDAGEHDADALDLDGPDYMGRVIWAGLYSSAIWAGQRTSRRAPQRVNGQFLVHVPVSSQDGAGAVALWTVAKPAGSTAAGDSLLLLDKGRQMVSKRRSASSMLWSPQSCSARTNAPLTASDAPLPCQQGDYLAGIPHKCHPAQRFHCCMSIWATWS